MIARSEFIKKKTGVLKGISIFIAVVLSIALVFFFVYSRFGIAGFSGILGLNKQHDLKTEELSKISGVPHTTINDIFNGKSKIGKCSADTVYKIAIAMNVSMEALLDPTGAENDFSESRVDFETFKSNVRHRIKDIGDIDFIVEMIESDKIRKYFDNKQHPEALYLLAMLDYLSRINGLPVCTRYSGIRSSKLKSPVFPASVIVMSAAAKDESIKRESLKGSIPEFKRFNIAESDIRDVV